MAEQELTVRQEIYGYDVFAWVLHKLGRDQEAVAPMTIALELGTKDARLCFHAGMIYHRLGQTEQARVCLQRALTTHPHFHIVHAEQARRLLESLTP